MTTNMKVTYYEGNTPIVSAGEFMGASRAIPLPKSTSLEGVTIMVNPYDSFPAGNNITFPLSQADHNNALGKIASSLLGKQGFNRILNAGRPSSIELSDEEIDTWKRLGNIAIEYLQEFGFQ
jgi:hypothetical protein